MACFAASPNPVSGASRFSFTLPSASRVTLRLLGVDGRAVRTLLAENRAAGSHVVAWDGRDARGASAPAGVYFARIEVDGRSRALRVVKLD